MQFKKNVNLTLALLWYTFAITELVLFFYGYFYIKNNSTHIFVPPPSMVNHAKVDAYDYYRPAAAKLIFIVIDALRRDFVTEKYMPFLYSQVQEKDGCLLTLRAQAPTVTMPRIKALTTGSVPQYIDIVLNLASSEIENDNWLHQGRKLNYRMVFYGDDTWLKLYPNVFERSEGTTSFFVTDFTEVDNNVTRNIPNELKIKDWQFLILHYLGLDHIGHIYGPFHPLIDKKLLEMDNIIKDIYSDVKDQHIIMMITGDHGMRDSGGHGGSTDAETLVPLAVLGIPCLSNDHYIFAQTDIAPTISALMSLPLPTNNVGRILVELIQSYSLPRQLYLLHYNALNLIEKDLNTILNQFKNVFHKHEEFVKFGNNSAIDMVKQYEEILRETSDTLIRTSRTQSISFLYLASSALAIILLAVLVPIRKFLYFWSSLYFINTLLIILMLCSPEHSVLSKFAEIFCIVPVFALVYILPTLFELIQRCSRSSLLVFLCGGTIVRTISFASSSFIEEEHQTWYFLWGSLTVLGAYKELKSLRRSWVNMCLWFILFVGLRLCRQWNQGWLQIHDHWPLLVFVFVIGLAGIVLGSSQIFRNDKMTTLLIIVIAIVILWYRITVHYYRQVVVQAQIASVLILLTAVVTFITHRNILKTLTVVWILWTALLMRPHNVVLIPICVAASHIIQRVAPSVTCSTLMHIWLQSILFHCQGFHNSLASIDISPGYVGVLYYCPIRTAFQVISNVYTFQILSMLLLMSNLKNHDQDKALYTVILHRLFSIMYYCIIIIIQRSHLFVWSVFSPKLLIEACHSLCLLLCLFVYKILRFVCIEKEQLHQFTY